VDALDELRALSKPRKGPPCGLLGVHLDGKDWEALQAGLLDPTITAKAITAFLDKRGFAVSFWTVARHRRGECVCPR
jgi:hypothetical protein